MERVASNNAQAVIKNSPVFAGRNVESFQEYKSKLRVCQSLYSEDVFEVFQGKAQQPLSTLGRTDAATLNAVAEHKYLQVHQCLWSVLLLTASRSANSTVKTFEGKRPEYGSGHGQLAWKALAVKYNGHTEEARRACHEKLVNTKMEPGQDPDDFVFVLDECRDLLEEMGHTVHDERYEGIILQALPPKYERVRTARYERREVGLDDIRHMVHTMYVDNRSCSVSAKPVTGRDIAMQVVGHTSVTCSATTAKDTDTSRRTAPS